MCRKILQVWPLPGVFRSLNYLQEVHEEEGVIRECAYTGEDELDGKRRIGNKGKSSKY